MRKFLKHFPFNKVFTALFVLFYTFLPSAQGIGIVIAESSVGNTAEVDISEDILEDGISDPKEIANPEVLEEEIPESTFEDGVYTVNSVELKEYVYPDNEDVRVKFTNITEEGNLVISKVELTEEEKEELNTSDDYGWDISSGMSNGSFTYDLTLPNTSGNDDIEVKYTEDGEIYESIEDVVVNEEVIYIEGLEHFTVFVVVNSLPAGYTEGNLNCPIMTGSVCYNTIQEAINAAQSNGDIEQDVINIQNGTYNECLNISGNNIKLLGESKTGVVVNNTSCTSYGIHVHEADRIIFKNMTVNGALSSYTFKIANSTNIELRQINVNNSYRTGIDLNGVNGAFINNVKIVNTIRGFGLMIKDSNDIEIGNVKTVNNAWGGVSVQTEGNPYPGGVDNVIFTGNFNVSETVPLLLEKDPPTYHDITNITVPAKFNYIVYTLRERDNYKQWFYRETLEDAKLFAAGLITSSPFTYSDILIYDIAEENYWTIPNMLIQDAIDDATNNDVIHITEGTYEEQLSVDGKDLVLDGDGEDKTFVNSPDTLSTLYTTSAANKPILYVHNSNSTIQNLTIDGLGKGNANYRMQGISYYNAGGKVNNVEIKNVKDTPASGAQHGVGLYVYIDDEVNRVIDVNNVNIHDYQKNGTVFAGEGLTANISNSVIYGLGEIDFIAQNGIQYSYGATGTAEGNEVSGNYYTPSEWGATAILVYDAGDNVKITDNRVHDNGGYGVYLWARSNSEISNNYIYNNWGDGIDLIGINLENVKVFDNIVENNDYGIWIDSDVPNNLAIYNNTFNNTVNAEDEGNHYFDNGTIGNFWSDYDGLDLDGDGVADTKDYVIDTDSSDRYPLTDQHLSVQTTSITTDKPSYKRGDKLSIAVELTNNGTVPLETEKENLVVNITNPEGTYISGTFRGKQALDLQPGESRTITFYSDEQFIPDTWIEGDYRIQSSVYSNRAFPKNYLMGGQHHSTTFTVDNTHPTIGTTTMYVNDIETRLTKPGDTVKVTTEVIDPVGIDKVQLWFRNLASTRDLLKTGYMTHEGANLYSFEFVVPKNYEGAIDLNEDINGNYFTFRTYDSLGNYGYRGGANYFTIDNTPPAIPTATLTAKGLPVLTNGYTDSETFTFNLASTDPVRYQLKYWNDIPTSRFKESTPWNPTNLSGYSSALGVYNDKFSAGEGKHYFSFSACDIAGNCSDYSTQPFVVYYDKTAPTTTITSPTSGYITNTTPEITGYTEDTYSVDKVVLSYTNYNTDTSECGATWTELTTITNANKEILPFNWSYNEWNLEDGAYCIKAQATDLANNEENTAIVENITYDTTPPQITLLDLVLGVLRNVDANDSLSGIDKIEVSKDNIKWEDYTPDMDLNDLVGNQPGTYTIYIRVTDKAGNPTEDLITFTIPSPTPTTTQTAGEILGVKSPLNPTPVQALGTGGYLYTQTTNEEQDTEEEETTEGEIATQEEDAEVKGEEDNGEQNSEEETTEEEGTKWWVYPLVILPVLAIFLILWKRRKEEDEPQF